MNFRKKLKKKERIVATLFKQYFGFHNYREGLTIECYDSETHAGFRGNKHQTYGVGGQVHYKPPLDKEIL